MVEPDPESTRSGKEVGLWVRRAGVTAACRQETAGKPEESAGELPDMMKMIFSLNGVLASPYF